LNAVQNVSPHGVSGVLQLQPKPTRSNPFSHLTEGLAPCLITPSLARFICTT
jgi:hypothetical protein